MDAGDCSFFPSFMPSGPGGHLELIEGVGCGPGVRSEMAHVLVAASGDATAEAVDLIEAVGEEKGVGFLTGFFAIRSHEGTALHLRVVLESDKREGGRRKINEGNNFIADGAVFKGAELLPFFRDMDDHRDANAGVVEVALAARSRTTVVSIVENNGVIGEAVLLKFGEDAANLRVERGHGVVVNCEVVTHLREIGEVGRKCEFGGIEAWGLGDDVLLAIASDF